MTDTKSINMQTVDVRQIMRLIPHRYPFLLIDRIIDIVPGESGTGVKNVTANEPHFQGHFPDFPIMPGVLIVEAMAQTAGSIVMLGLGDANAANKLVYFMSIDEARFRKPVVPGDVLHIKVTKIQSRRNVWKFKGEAYVGETLCAEATYSAMIIDREQVSAPSV